MRFALVIVGIFIISMVVAFEANSQSNDTRYSTRGGFDVSNNKVYNSAGSSYGTGGPISLKQIIQGRERAATGDRYSSYGSTYSSPYSISPSQYSLNISPEQIRASRERRDFLAQQAEQESLEDIVNPQEVAATNNIYRPPSVSVSPTGRPNSVYIRRDKDFDVPKKVFRSIY